MDLIGILIELRSRDLRNKIHSYFQIMTCPYNSPTVLRGIKLGYLTENC